MEHINKAKATLAEWIKEASSPEEVQKFETVLKEMCEGDTIYVFSSIETMAPFIQTTTHFEEPNQPCAEMVIRACNSRVFGEKDHPTDKISALTSHQYLTDIYSVQLGDKALIKDIVAKAVNAIACDLIRRTGATKDRYLELYKEQHPGLEIRIEFPQISVEVRKFDVVFDAKSILSSRVLK